MYCDAFWATIHPPAPESNTSTTSPTLGEAGSVTVTCLELASRYPVLDWAWTNVPEATCQTAVPGVPERFAPVSTGCPSTVMPAPLVAKKAPPCARTLKLSRLVEVNGAFCESAQTNAP